MLPPFIIEQIRKREREERVHREQPTVELPRHAPNAPSPARPASPSEDDVRRGVIILEL